jgi:glycyl-radical enzyme activating protein
MPAVETKGLIFDIQGHSIHDGPGTRTLVFLSGCPLRCKWCSNPEGLILGQRLMYKSRLCRNCPARCVSACPQGAVQLPPDGLPVVFNRMQCDCCETRDCINVCYTGALQASGKWYSVDELMQVFNRDRCYWGPQGGVTLTGGEPLMQEEFVLALLEHCQRVYVDTCVETSGYIPRSVLQAALPRIHWLFVDLKHMDSAKHLEATSVPNEMIIENIRWIANSDWPGKMVLRMPVIPGFNDDVANAQATAAFLDEIGQREINLLPFHRLGASKYEQLGMTYEYAEQAAPDEESLESLAAAYRQRGIACHLGANTPF